MSPYTRAALALVAAPALALRMQKNNSTSSGYVVTMGDSYASGTGIHKLQSDYHNGDACCRDFETTPGAQLANQQGKQHIMPACAGDEIPQINQQFTNMQAEYPEEAARGWEGSTMIFTIGGNDVRSHGGDAWPGLLTNCIISFSGNCHSAADNQIANFAEVEAQLTAFYERLAEGASKATIRVWGYPRLLQRTWHCIPVPGVSSAATQWMDDMVDEMNSHMASAVATAKSRHSGVDIEFIDVRSYLTKGACSTSGNHVHSLVLAGGGLSPMTFHPSQRGYNQYYNALANGLASGLDMAPSQVSTGSGKPWYMDRIFAGWDEEGDGYLSIGEVLNMGGDDAAPEASRILRKAFAYADADEDEALNLKEFETFIALVEKTTP